MSDEYADGRYRYGTDALVADNRIGPNFGKPMIHRPCSQQVSDLQSQLAARDAEVARLREIKTAAAALTARTPCFLTIRPTGDIECCQFCLEDNGHATGCEWVALVAALAAPASGDADQT